MAYDYACPSIFNRDGSLKSQAKLDGELQVWIRAAIKEGNEFLKSCRAYPHIDKAIDIIAREVDEKQTTAMNLSQSWANNTKRDIKEMCAILSNIRPSWLYEANSSRDTEWIRHSRILNGLSADWYNEANVDITLKKLLELGTVEGTGYISPIWNPELNRGEGDIELKLYRYNEVLPVQIGRDFDLQRAYAVILVDEMPIMRAYKTFPLKRHLMIPDRGETRMARSTVLSATKSEIKGFWDAITDGSKEKRKTYPSPVIDILYIYVDDFSINPTNHEVPMGESSWAYMVPYIGQEIPIGYNTDGSRKTRKATYEDCKLYPNRRLIIASKNAILYDGPSYWWHRNVPVAKYSPDEWIFSYLGFSMAAEVFNLDRSANKMRRDIEDALHIKIDPPVAVDEMSMSKTQAESKSLRAPGRRIRGKLQMGDFIKGILPPETYNVGTDHFAFVEKVEQKIKDILGLPDLMALQQARQIPASDTVSQFFAQAGAIVTSMSRTLDPVMKFVADCNRYYFMQFVDVTRRIKVLGEDGFTTEDIDFDPGTLIPKSLPNEPSTANGLYVSTRFERARWHMNNFRTTIEPTSLHQITHLQRKLLLMQATKLIPGYLFIDPETIAKELDIQNWGHIEGDTIQEKVLNFMKFMEQFQLSTMADQAKLQLMIQAMAAQASPQGQMANAMSQAGDAIGQGISSNGQKSLGVPTAEGRPPSFEAPPQLEDKGGRTTIATS